jgi:hypothetical protein
VLTPLDDNLSHQLPVTYDNAFTSDHQFFDRDWFSANHRSGEVALITGMAAYKNTNVCDGFVAVQHDGRQYNLRLSRELRPASTEMKVGPLTHELVEPLWKIRLALEPGEYAVSCDLLWEGVLPAHEEPHYFTRTNGRVSTDYTRYDQAGKVSGWIEIEGQRFEADDWWGCRDHSWGVRSGVGGWEVENGSSDAVAMMAALAGGGAICWTDFATEELGGHVQFSKNGAGKFLDIGFPMYGFIRYRDDFDRSVAIVDADLDWELYPGSTAWRRAEIRATTEDGAKWEIEAKPLHTAWAYLGTGYDHGWTDCRGLGAYRGSFAMEHDVYDVSDPALVFLLPEKTPLQMLHREQPASILVNGQPGNAHTAFFRIPTPSA